MKKIIIMLSALFSPLFATGDQTNRFSIQAHDQERRLLAIAENRNRDLGANAILKLMETVDSYIPQPVCLVNRPFLMPIEDVFSISGRGTFFSICARLEKTADITEEQKESIQKAMKAFHALPETPKAVNLANIVEERKDLDDDLKILLRKHINKQREIASTPTKAILYFHAQPGTGRTGRVIFDSPLDHESTEEKDKS